MNSDGSVVLYVDDDPTNRRLMARLFERYRQTDELLLTGSGAEAINLAGTKRPDLVLLDLNLPDFSGEDVLTTLRIRSDVPVVILSGDADEWTRRRLINLGATAYVTKPFDVTELFQLIGSVIAGEPSQSEGDGIRPR